MFIHECLDKPKSTDDLQNILQEHGLEWNKNQIELYALLDPAIYLKNGKWIAQKDERRQVILAAIEKALGYRPMTKIDPDVMAHITGDYIIPILEVKEVALSTERYEFPRANIIRRKR